MVPANPQECQKYWPSEEPSCGIDACKKKKKKLGFKFDWQNL